MSDFTTNDMVTIPHWSIIPLSQHREGLITVKEAKELMLYQLGGLGRTVTIEDMWEFVDALTVIIDRQDKCDKEELMKTYNVSANGTPLPNGVSEG